ncbi:MAG: YkvA family protein [Patescibacteria group bacterium]
MKNTKFIPYWKNLINFFKDKKTDWKPKAAVGFAILYLIWPADLIPDLAPILGWLDDIGITALATGYLAYAVNKYISKSDVDRSISQVSEVKK